MNYIFSVEIFRLTSQVARKLKIISRSGLCPIEEGEENADSKYFYRETEIKAKRANNICSKWFTAWKNDEFKCVGEMPTTKVAFTARNSWKPEPFEITLVYFWFLNLITLFLFAFFKNYPINLFFRFVFSKIITIQSFFN